MLTLPEVLSAIHVAYQIFLFYPTLLIFVSLSERHILFLVYEQVELCFRIPAMLTSWEGRRKGVISVPTHLCLPLLTLKMLQSCDLIDVLFLDLFLFLHLLLFFYHLLVFSVIQLFL